MNIDAGFSIVISFVSFGVIFIKKVYPVITKKLDAHITDVKSKINEAESMRNEAALILKKAYEKKDSINKIIEENQKISQKRFEKLQIENEIYIKQLQERYKASMQNQLDAELAKQKKQLIDKLSDLFFEKLSNEVNVKTFHSEVNTNIEFLQKLN